MNLTEDLARETLIALRDRAHTLRCEIFNTLNEAVADIARRQLNRVNEAGRAIADQLGETF